VNGTSGLTAVSSLEDPVRARLYQVVCQRAGPVGRDEAAAAAGIGRPLAAYHLDKLVELGLLTASYQRLEGRAGPGAGRPAKVYARSGREFAVTVPPRDYEIAARLLAVAVESDRSGTCRAALLDAARQYGATIGNSSRSETAGRPSPQQALELALRQHGFEPWRADDGAVRMRNCPFHQLAALHPDLVCGMNLALIDGLAAGLGASGMCAELDPQPGRCCVVISASSSASETTTGRS
jgi:predicted ArsR family transcriptional regulator